MEKLNEGYDPLSLYLQEVNTIHSLKKSEEKILFQKFSDCKERLGDPTIDDDTKDVIAREMREIRNCIVASNLKLVIFFAKRYTGRGVPFADLINGGNVGLTLAVEKFDLNTGNEFNTYARYWIVGEILMMIPNEGRTVRIPRGKVFQSVAKLRYLKRILTQKLGRKPYVEELVKEMFGDNLSKEEMAEKEEKVRFLLESSQELISLDFPVGGGDSCEEKTVGDYITDDKIESPFEIVNKRLIQEKVFQVLDGFSERNKRIFELRYGLNDCSEHNLAEIGKFYGISRQRVDQIVQICIEQIRTTLGIDLE